MPGNDDYLNFVQTNTPGTVFAHNSPVQWTIPGDDPLGDIEEATTQEGGMGDPANTAENLSCDGAPFERTVWYWAFPDVSGWLQVRTSGGDAVIRVLAIAGNLTPNFNDSACIDDPTDLSNEEIFTGVVGGAGRRYAIQVGVFGSSAWTATHLTRVTFFRDRDLDGLFDPSDRCPTQGGPASQQGCADSDGDKVVDIDDRCPTSRGTLRGCPDGDGDGIADLDDRCRSEPTLGRDANRNGCRDLARFGANIVAMPNSTFFSRTRTGFVRNGVVIGNLVVSGIPTGARVELRCSQRSTCRRTVKRARSSVNFKRQLRGKRLRARKSVVIRVTRTGYVGRWFRITAKRRGKRGVVRTRRCIVPGTRRIRACSRVSAIR